MKPVKWLFWPPFEFFRSYIPLSVVDAICSVFTCPFEIGDGAPISEIMKILRKERSQESGKRRDAQSISTLNNGEDSGKGVIKGDKTERDENHWIDKRDDDWDRERNKRMNWGRRIETDNWMIKIRGTLETEQVSYLYSWIIMNYDSYHIICWSIDWLACEFMLSSQILYSFLHTTQLNPCISK